MRVGWRECPKNDARRNGAWCEAPALANVRRNGVAGVRRGPRRNAQGQPRSPVAYSCELDRPASSCDGVEPDRNADELSHSTRSIAVQRDGEKTVFRIVRSLLSFRCQRGLDDATEFPELVECHRLSGIGKQYPQVARQSIVNYRNAGPQVAMRSDQESPVIGPAFEGDVVGVVVPSPDVGVSAPTGVESDQSAGCCTTGLGRRRLWSRLGFDGWIGYRSLCRRVRM